jgi:hypothetical protein
MINLGEKNQQIKMISRTHVVWIRQDTSQQDAYGYGGAKYTLDGDNYTEHWEICSIPEWLGKSFTFKMKVEGNTLIQSGAVPMKEMGIWDSDVEFYEVYKRLD